MREYFNFQNIPSEQGIGANPIFRSILNNAGVFQLLEYVPSRNEI